MSRRRGTEKVCFDVLDHLVDILDGNIRIDVHLSDLLLGLLPLFRGTSLLLHQLNNVETLLFVLILLFRLLINHAEADVGDF